MDRQMNKKELVLAIQKMAAGPDLPVGTPGVGSVKPTGAVTGKPGNTSAGVLEIKEMQKAIQAFADKAVAYKTKVQKDPKTGKTTKIVDTTDNRKDFNDFLTEQYSEGAAAKGDEYSPDPKAVTKEDKKPTELVEMDIVIDGLRRIGPGGSEQMPDGRWDFRTNNAVNNTYAFAETLVKVTDDFGGVPPNASWYFKSNDLNAMKTYLLPKETDFKSLKPEDLKKRAVALTPLIKKLTAFYEQYQSRIINHPAYKNYINKSYPLFTVTSGGKDPGKLTPEQQALMKQPGQMLKNITLPGKKGLVKSPKLSVGYFSNMENFRSLMYSVLGYSPTEVNNNAFQKQVLDAVIKHVNDNLAAKVPASVSTLGESKLNNGEII